MTLNGRFWKVSRVTYLATEINSQKQVVIKQFQFAHSGATWSEYDAYQREIEVMKGLEHPSIPRYLDSFQTSAGFCMVQEYKNAPCLLVPRQWKPQEIKHIAIAVLEILNYLQTRIPQVIHRDIKPDNILVDRQINVYLVDFGFASIGSGQVAVSSVVKGTLGFMPPEQLFNRQLTAASDLYGLGATLICLLTETHANEVGSLMDDAGRINFKQRVTKLHPDFIKWLQKMAEPNYKQRYANAKEALDALIPLSVLRPLKPQKLIMPTLLGLGAVGVIILAVVKIQSISSNGIYYSFFSQAKLSYNADFNQDLEKISLSKNRLNRVYFQVKSEWVKSGNNLCICQVINSSGDNLYQGISTLVPEGNSLDAWCFYDFKYPDNYDFQFFLNGQKIANKSLTVLP
ncbi:MAG: serine/threonine-protein kinase [Phormidium sp.]